MKGMHGLTTMVDPVQLAWSVRPELLSVISRTNSELLRHLALGIDADTEWEDIPDEVRRAVSLDWSCNEWSGPGRHVG